MIKIRYILLSQYFLFFYKNYHEKLIKLMKRPMRTYFVRKIMCKPLSVSTIPDISPILSENAASSKGRCMTPRLNFPNEPPFLYELQSEYFEANSSKDSPESIFFRYFSSISRASLLLRVIFSLRWELGRRLPSCFTNKWLASTSLDSFFAGDVGRSLSVFN